MKGFIRNNQSFSLCGLNCALCSMKLGGYCPGCGGGDGNQGCRIARCAIKHGIDDYCSACEEYPCWEYDGITEYDSFITHRNQMKDMNEMNRIGVEAYNSMLERKAQILLFL